MNPPPLPPERPDDPRKILRQILQFPGAQENPRLLFLIRSYEQIPLRETYESILREFEKIKALQVDPEHPRNVKAGDPVTQPGILLGRDPRSGQPVGLSWNDAMKNILLTGAMGVGKTTLLRHVLWQCLQQRISFLAFQKRLNQFEFLPSVAGESPTRLRLDEMRDALFEFPALALDEERLHLFRTVMNLVHDLTQREDSTRYARQALPRLLHAWPMERIRREGFPTVKDLLRAMEGVYRREGNKKNGKLYQSACTVWDTLWEENRVFRARRGMYAALRRHPTVVVYDAAEVQQVWLLTLLQVIRVLQENDALPPEEKRPFVVLLDDVQDLVAFRDHSRLPPFLNYMNIARENLCPFILSFQTAQHVFPELLSSAGTLLIGRLPNGEEAVRMTRILGLHPRYASLIQTLPPGQFLLHSPASRGVVQFQGEPWESPYPPDARAWREANEARRKQIYLYAPYPVSSPTPHSKKASERGSSTAFRILSEIYNHPFSILSDIRLNLRLSPGAFNREVENLEKRKWIRKWEISRIKTLEISAEGYRVLGQPVLRYPGHFPHAFGVHWIEKFFLKKGWKVRREQTLPGAPHRIDLLAIQGEQLLALEYETGSSEILLNLSHCLETTATLIYIVFSSEKLSKQNRREIQRSPRLAPALERGRIRLGTLWEFVRPNAPSDGS